MAFLFEAVNEHATVTFDISREELNELTKKTKVTPFDYINAINNKVIGRAEESPDLLKEYKDGYQAFMVNRGFSQYADTIFFANEMNKNSFLDADMQFDFFYSAIPKKKRFAKWAKADPKDEMVERTAKYYGVSLDRALEYLEIMTQDQINSLNAILDVGGRAK